MAKLSALLLVGLSIGATAQGMDYHGSLVQLSAQAIARCLVDASLAYQQQVVHLVPEDMKERIRQELVAQHYTVFWDLFKHTIKSTCLKGHTDIVRAVALSPGNTHALTGSADGTVRIWDSGTGDCLKALPGHTDHVTSVAWSSDATLVASGSWDRTVRVWAVKQDAMSIFKGHTDTVLCVCFNYANTHVASGSYDNTVYIWDITQKTEPVVIACGADAITAVRFSPDGKHLLTGSATGTVKLWNSYTGTCERVFNGPVSRIKSVAFDPHGKYVFSASWHRAIRCLHVETGICAHYMPYTNDQRMYSCDFSADGTYALEGTLSGQVYVWDIHNRKELATLSGHKDIIRALAFSADKTHVITGSHDNNACIWDLRYVMGTFDIQTVLYIILDRLKHPRVHESYWRSTYEHLSPLIKQNLHKN